MYTTVLHANKKTAEEIFIKIAVISFNRDVKICSVVYNDYYSIESITDYYINKK